MISISTRDVYLREVSWRNELGYAHRLGGREAKLVYHKNGKKWCKFWRTEGCPYRPGKITSEFWNNTGFSLGGSYLEV